MDLWYPGIIPAYIITAAIILALVVIRLGEEYMRHVRRREMVTRPKKLRRKP